MESSPVVGRPSRRQTHTRQGWTEIAWKYEMSYCLIETLQ